MATRIEWTDAGGAVQAIEFDATVRQDHELGAEVTDHAVERGGAITDHVRPTPAVLTLDAHVSATPMRQPATQAGGATGEVRALEVRVGQQVYQLQVLQFSGDLQRPRAVDQLLQGLIANGTVVRCVTALRTYEDMVIRSFKVSRDAATGRDLPVVLELRRVRLVATERVSVPAPVQRRGQPTRNRGAQPARPVDNRSAAARVLDAGREQIRALLGGG